MSLAGDKDDRICQVCGNIAHGIHFHVVSCRACAAFFRRSAKDGETYRCTRVMKECDVTRNSCRYCRLQKCKQLGMNLDRLEGKYQKQKKVVENEPNCSSPPDSVVDDGSLPSVDVESHNFKYDANSQMLKVLGILNESSRNRLSNTSILGPFLKAYEGMIPRGTPEKIQIAETVNFRLYLKFKNEQMERIAKLTMECGEFARLPLGDKRKMFCNFWPYVYSLERCARTVEFMGPSCSTEINLLTDKIAVDWLRFEYSFPDICDEEQVKAINAHFQTFNKLNYDTFIAPMRRLKVKAMEVIYLCLYKMWNVDKIDDISAATKNVAIRVIEEASTELHTFYIEELGTNNYAARISKLFALLEGLNASFRFRRDLLVKVDAFRLYNNELNQSEFNNFSNMEQQCFSQADEQEPRCLVCGAEAHGIHFQVNSCRACAAFFRRAIEGGECRYKCRRAQNNCDVSKDATHPCRRCRYERCKQVGMAITPTSHIRTCRHDNSHTTGTPASRPKLSSDRLASYPNQPAEVVFEGQKLNFKAENIIGQIKEVLYDSKPSNPAFKLAGVRLTPMQSLIQAYSTMVPGGPKNIELLTVMDTRILNFFQLMTKRIAVWMMACQEFAELPMEDKWKIYVNFWPHMFSVERAARTIEFLGVDAPPNIILLNDTVAIDILNYDFVVPNMPLNKQKGVRELFKAHDEAIASHLIAPMKALNITTPEVVYLCIQLMWTIHKVKGLSESTYETASRILDQTEHEIHNYYVADMRMENYASRLAKIVKLMSESDSLYRQRKDASLTGDLFGIFSSDLHESELNGRD